MQKIIITSIALLVANLAAAQTSFPKNALSINVFRNPSIGLEYQHRHVSVHGGYYITAFTSGVTTKFLKTGVTYWFLPFGKKEIRSSLYAGASYLRGLNLDYQNTNAIAIETGVRLMIWKGLNARLGVIGLAAKGHSFKVNPTPSLSYTLPLNR